MSLDLGLQQYFAVVQVLECTNNILLNLLLKQPFKSNVDLLDIKGSSSVETIKTRSCWVEYSFNVDRLTMEQSSRNWV